MRLILVALLGSLMCAVGATNATWTVKLAWTPVADSDIAGYLLYQRGSGQEFRPVQSITNATSATVTNVIPGTTNWFAVTAYNTSGLESDYSNVVEFRGAPRPAAPTGMTVTTSIVVRVEVILSP